MIELEKCRQNINDIDIKIAELFCARMNEAKKVARYKKENGLKIYDEKREAFLIERNSRLIADIDLRSYYINFLKNMMDISKQYQYRLLNGMKVACSGVEGAFAHIAARKIFPSSRFIFFGDFQAAYASVENGECDCCVLPIENSYAGEVTQVTDLLFTGSLFINGVYDLEICHSLLGMENSTLSDIRTVISHPQALSQCEGYIRSHGLSQISQKNTALSALMVAEGNDRSVAAIASRETAELYGLKVLDHDINESSGNTTRFAVLSRAENDHAQSAGKFIMMFTVRNEAGALAGAINIIGKHGFNMRVLRSRPIKDEPWQYYFYVEAEGNVHDEKAQKMLSELSAECEKVKVAGSYISEEKLPQEDIRDDNTHGS